MVPPQFETLLAAALRGEAVPWLASAGPREEAEFLEATLKHGLQPLLARQLRASGMSDQWPERLTSVLGRATRSQTLAEKLHGAELRRVLAALGEGGVTPLLIKGGALVYSHYPEPWLRPRRDTDLLIRSEDVQPVKRIMQDLGYYPPTYVEAENTIQQFHYLFVDGHGVQHVFDIHWRISNVRLFADLVEFEELSDRAVAVPRLGPNARAPGPIDALLVTCLHRVAHHNDQGDLIWIYDIHLLAGGMTDAEWQRFTSVACEKRVRTVCARGLELSCRWFHTAVPANVLDALEGRAGLDQPEHSAAFLGSDTRQVDVLISNLRVIRNWRERLQLVREHVFPSSSFMLQSYRVSTRALLPVLYTHRILRGAWRFLSRPIG